MGGAYLNMHVIPVKSQSAPTITMCGAYLDMHVIRDKSQSASTSTMGGADIHMHVITASISILHEQGLVQRSSHKGYGPQASEVHDRLAACPCDVTQVRVLSCTCHLTKHHFVFR